MFNAFLSGRIFALPLEIEVGHLELARRWSGQSLDSNLNRVCWEDLASVVTAEHRPWFTPPPPAMIPVQNGIVFLGSEKGANFFAFISPLSAVSEAFKNSALAYVQERYVARTALIESVSVDLTALVRDNWGMISRFIRSVEGEAFDGSHLVITMPSQRADQRSPLVKYLKSVSSIEIESENHPTKVDDTFGIQVDDVSAEFNEIASSISATFALLKGFSKLNFHETLAYN